MNYLKSYIACVGLAAGISCIHAPVLAQTAAAPEADAVSSAGKKWVSVSVPPISLEEQVYGSLKERTAQTTTLLKDAYDAGDLNEYLNQATTKTVLDILKLDADKNKNAAEAASLLVQGQALELVNREAVETQLGLPGYGIRLSGLVSQKDLCQGYTAVIDAAERLYRTSFTHLSAVSKALSSLGISFVACENTQVSLAGYNMRSSTVPQAQEAVEDGGSMVSEKTGEDRQKLVFSWMDKNADKYLTALEVEAYRRKFGGNVQDM